MKKTKHRTKMKLGKSGARAENCCSSRVTDLCGSDVVSDDFLQFPAR